MVTSTPKVLVGFEDPGCAPTFFLFLNVIIVEIGFRALFGEELSGTDEHGPRGSCELKRKRMRLCRYKGSHLNGELYLCSNFVVLSDSNLSLVMLQVWFMSGLSVRDMA